MATLRIINWNVEWATSASARGREIARIIADQAPDVVCLTESDEALIREPGHVIASDPDYGYPLKPGRRKVLLWSRRPWTEVDPFASPQLPPRRFVAGRTQTPIGPVRIAGLCVPWKDAHCRTGRRDRTAWQDHIAYLSGLTALDLNASCNVLIGDFNQAVPRRNAPKEAYHLLQAAVAGFEIVTAGPIAPADHATVDHVALASGFAATNLRSLRNESARGTALSDHFGIALDITRDDHDGDRL